LNCNKPLKSGQTKFCSNSCSAKYNNKRRKLSQETKDKISNGLKSHYNSNDSYYSEKRKRRMYKITCVICNKPFYSKRKNVTHCSAQCIANDKLVREKLRNSQLKKVKEGTHSGWKSRNIKSYAEKFWEKVLINNKINYIKEDHSNKKYFLDFLIKKNNILIDLEIDGKQHKLPERQQSDVKRDEYLKKLGYIIYRIDWNEINTEKGKTLMETKIQDFLNFYNKI